MYQQFGSNQSLYSSVLWICSNSSKEAIVNPELHQTQISRADIIALSFALNGQHHVLSHALLVYILIVVIDIVPTHQHLNG